MFVLILGHNEPIREVELTVIWGENNLRNYVKNYVISYVNNAKNMNDSIFQKWDKRDCVNKEELKLVVM